MMRSLCFDDRSGSELNVISILLVDFRTVGNVIQIEKNEAVKLGNIYLM